MKKTISIFATALLIIGLLTTTALADTKSTTGGGVSIGKDAKNVNNMQKQLAKAQSLLVKLNERQVQIEKSIQESIAKATINSGNKVANTEKQIQNGKATEDKLQASIDKMAANDKIEQDNLTNDIAKATEVINNQEAALTTQLTTIDTNLAKQLAELATKLAAATTDVAKQSIAASELSANTYARQKKDAINAYLAIVKSDLTSRQEIWNSRQALLNKRQTARTAYRTAMVAIDKAIIDAKLSTLSTVQATPATDIETAVRARFQKEVDTNKANIVKTTALIANIQAQLNK